MLSAIAADVSSVSVAAAPEAALEGYESIRLESDRRQDRDAGSRAGGFGIATHGARRRDPDSTPCTTSTPFMCVARAASTSLLCWILPAFTKRIVLTKTEILRLDDQPRGCGAVSLLKIVAWALEDKTENQTEEVSSDDSDGDTVDDHAFTEETHEPVLLETDVRGVCAGRSCRCSCGDVGRRIAAVGGNLPSERGDAAAQLANALEECDKRYARTVLMDWATSSSPIYI